MKKVSIAKHIKFGRHLRSVSGIVLMTALWLQCLWALVARVYLSGRKTPISTDVCNLSCCLLAFCEHESFFLWPMWSSWPCMIVLWRPSVEYWCCTDRFDCGVLFWWYILPPLYYSSSEIWLARTSNQHIEILYKKEKKWGCVNVTLLRLKIFGVR